MDEEDPGSDDELTMLPGRERSIFKMYTLGLTAKSINLFLKNKGRNPGREEDRFERIELQENSPGNTGDQGQTPQTASEFFPSEVNGQSGVTVAEEQESSQNVQNHTCDVFRRIYIYGNPSIWHHMLYGPEIDKDEHPRSDLLCGLVLVVALVVTTIIVTKYQLEGSPSTVDTYLTYNTTDNVRNNFTCGCILPPSLPNRGDPTNTTNLNICYLPSSLETVTILLFGNSSSRADEFIRREIDVNGAGIPVNVMHNGSKLTQEAQELTIQDLPKFQQALSDHGVVLFPGNVERE
jgi:hypothetical protein